MTTTTDLDMAARLTTADGGVLEIDIQDSAMGSHPVGLHLQTHLCHHPIWLNAVSGSAFADPLMSSPNLVDALSG